MEENKTKISQLPLVQELGDEDVFPIVQKGSNYGVSVNAMKKHFGGGASSSDGVYNTELPEAQSTPSDVGGIKAGTTVGNLKGKTYTQMFDELLFPTVVPTYIAPTATLSLKSYSSIQKVGSDAPTEASFTTGYNAGEIRLNGVKQSNRAGSLNSNESSIYVKKGTGMSPMPTTVALGDTSYVYRAAYSAGPQPKDSKGNDYGSPLPSGYVDSPAVTVNSTYPYEVRLKGSSTMVEKLTACSVSGSNGTISIGKIGTLPSSSSLNGADIFKVYGTLTKLDIDDVFSATGVSSLLDSLEARTDGNYTYYKYKSGLSKGEVTINNGTITFKI